MTVFETSDLFIEKMDEILKRQLTQKSFDLWIGIRERISNNCWKKPTSSTGKHHQKEDGRVPSVAEHTFEMLYAADKIIAMFEGLVNKDIIFLSIALHDSYKYGFVKTCKHTESKHDQIIGDMIRKNSRVFEQVFNEEEVKILEETVRFHSGRFSTNWSKDFTIKNFTPNILFLHMLDMLSSRNLLKILDVYK